MKRRFYALMLVVAMLAMTLVGCGSDTTNTTNTTNETEVNTEVEEEVVEPTEEPTTVPEVEEEVVEPTEEPTVVEPETSETPEFAYSHTWSFPDNMEGFTRKYLNDDLTEWSLNETHYVANDGTEMNFTWEGPASLGETAQSTETTVYLYSADLNYQLNAWYGGDITQEKFDKDLTFDKNTWTSFSTYNPYITDGYYDIQTTDTTIDVVYAVSNDTQMGYAYYLVDLNYGVCYQFIYLENMEVYDDARALNVINSIAYWEEYTPLETTTE